MTRLQVLLFSLLLSQCCLSQSIPANLRSNLQTEFGFSREELSRAESGQAVARIVPTGRPDDVRLAGIVLIHVSPDEFLKAYRDIQRFEISKDVVQTGKFSSPPVTSDLANFHAKGLNKSDVMACRPGRCAYKIPVEAIRQLQTEIDWKAPDARERIDDLVRKLCVNYVQQYELRGDAALAHYYDTASPYSVADGLNSLIRSESRISQELPQLVRFASEYPAERPANTEDFIYWQEAAFGLKHVLRFQHVMIERLDAEGGSRYAIISKMLFATHYFRAAVEFKYLVTVRTPSGEPAIYLVSAQRSFVDGMTGIKGAILHRIAEGRSPKALVENLDLAKERLERH